jgi:cation transport ATPase
LSGDWIPFASGRSNPDAELHPPETALTALDLQIEGMHCGACALRLERALAAEPGVRHAEVNYATASAHVLVAADRSGVEAPDAERLAAVVAATGYRVTDSSAPVDAEARDPLFWLSVLCAAPFLLSMLAMAAGWHALMLPPWLEFALATPGAVHGRCALLPRCLGVLARRPRQHGCADRARHQLLPGV